MSKNHVPPPQSYDNSLLIMNRLRECEAQLQATQVQAAMAASLLVAAIGQLPPGEFNPEDADPASFTATNAELGKQVKVELKQDANGVRVWIRPPPEEKKVVLS